MRIFLVGCARSGTTLYQSMLSAHPLICSLPETQFFPVLFGSLRKRMLHGDLQKKENILLHASKQLRIKAGVVYPRHQKTMGKIQSICKDLMIDFDFNEHRTSLFSARTYIDLFVKILDEYTVKMKSNFWLEKSPNHIYFIEEIERYIDTPIFLHIVRSGEDVVASIYDAWKKNPEGNDFSGNIDINIQRWNSAVEISKRYESKSNHHLIMFENLIAEPEVQLKKTCKFLGITYSDEMISKRASAAKKILHQTENWKSAVSGEIQSNRASKFGTVFSKTQQEYVKNRLVSNDIKTYVQPIRQG